MKHWHENILSKKTFCLEIGGGVDNRLIGHCHCGEVVFDVPVLRDFSAARRCDCSFPHRQAAVMVSCPQDSPKIKWGYYVLKLYQQNTHTAQHHFSKICRICTFHHLRTGPSVTGINIGCFDGLDLVAF